MRSENWSLDLARWVVGDPVKKSFSRVVGLKSFGWFRCLWGFLVIAFFFWLNEKQGQYLRSDTTFTEKILENWTLKFWSAHLRVFLFRKLVISLNLIVKIKYYIGLIETDPKDLGRSK